MENIIKLLRSIEKIILEDKEAAKEIAISQAELLKAIEILSRPERQKMTPIERLRLVQLLAKNYSIDELAEFTELLRKDNCTVTIYIKNEKEI